MLYVTDAINRIEQFKQELISKMPSISSEVATDFLIKKKEQIRTRGIGRYSTSLYPAYLLKGKELNSTGKSFLDQKMKKRENTNWAELRKAQGLQISFVDVYYSGQMLNSTGIERNNTVSYRYYSIIGATNDEAKKKMYLNMVRYGRFLTPTKLQEKETGERAISLVANIYKRILLT